jgi:hypothetical protein
MSVYFDCRQITRPFQEVDRICFETSYRIKPRAGVTHTVAPAVPRRGTSAASATFASAEPVTSATASAGDDDVVEEVRTPIVWESVTDVLSLGMHPGFFFFFFFYACVVE